MIKAAILSLAIACAVTALPSGSHAAPLGGVERIGDDVSAARKSKVRTARRARVRHGRRVYRRAAPGVAAGAPQQQGANVCGGDARRLCRSVLGQGDFAVLQCFQARARYLSRGCRGLLQSYGQL